MTRYALLALPSANRVYRASAPTLGAAELRLLGEGPLGGRLRDVAPTVLGGVTYLGFYAEFARSKAELVAHEGRRVDVVHADTLRAGEFFSPASFDVVVTDAPYGVHHGSRAAADRRTGGPGRAGRAPYTPPRSRKARSPLALLEEALPVWIALLRPGGAVGIAWNALVASRADLVAVLASAGLRPLDQGPYRDLEHRVDQAIVRDVAVARLPAAAS